MPSRCIQNLQPLETGLIWKHMVLRMLVNIVQIYVIQLKLTETFSLFCRKEETSPPDNMAESPYINDTTKSDLLGLNYRLIKFDSTFFTFNVTVYFDL